LRAEINKAACENKAEGGNMAERRMFAKSVIDSDLFLDMPPTTQMLYFHLAMRADDDGFINNPRRIQRMIGASDDDMRILIAKQFILTFQSGVIVIRHWKIHNYIQKDRYRPSTCEEKDFVHLDNTKAYEISDTKCIHDVSKEDTDLDTNRVQDGYVGKVRLGKVRLGKVRLDAAANTPSSGECQEKVQDLYDGDRGEVVTAFCDNLQAFAGNLVLEQLNDVYDRYGKQWCLAAIKEAAVNGGRSIQYVIKVLERWEREGFKSSRKKHRQANQADADELYKQGMAALKEMGMMEDGQDKQV
jgi:DnaD/phage-associated family protein